jgi:hypothetical protein
MAAVSITSPIMHKPQILFLRFYPPPDSFLSILLFRLRPLVATTTFAFWHEYCDWVKATFSFLVISKSYALQKDHTFQLLRLDA